MGFIEDLEKNIPSITENGAIGYKTSGKSLVDLNFRVPSFRESIDYDLFDRALSENPRLTLKWLLYLRDIKEGIGERTSFRKLLLYLCDNHYELGFNFVDTIDIENFGRFDDYIYVYMLTSNEDVKDIIGFYLNERLLSDTWYYYNGKYNKISLLAKWLPSNNASSSISRKNAQILMKNVFHMGNREYRKTLSMLRKHCAPTEVLSSANKWESIDYSKVPSKANIKYMSAFNRHDFDRRNQYLRDVHENKAKINCDSMFLYDIVHAYQHEDTNQTLEELWSNQKTIGTFSDTLVVRDGSGSMWTSIPNTSASAMEVGDSITIYCAERNTGEFKNKFITFSANPEIVSFSNNLTLKKKLDILRDNYDCTTTNIYKVFKLILDTAIRNKYTNSELPQTVLIVSDMEYNCLSTKDNLFEDIRHMFEVNGYKLPRLVFWNVNSRTNTVPLNENENGVILISGFSKNLVNMVLSNDIDPYKALVNVLNSDRYGCIDDIFDK